MESGSDGGVLDGAERHSDSWHEAAQRARGDPPARSSADGHSALGNTLVEEVVAGDGDLGGHERRRLAPGRGDA